MKETDKKNGRKGKIFWFLILHIALLIYSMTGLFSKNASMHPFLSLPFILFYAGMIMILVFYNLDKRYPQIMADLKAGEHENA